MAKKKSKQAAVSAAPEKTTKQKKEEIVERWKAYFGPGELTDWKRLMADLGFTQEFTSKNQCRKALDPVWVNIEDYLDDIDNGRPIRRFNNEVLLSQYTKEEEKFYPKNAIPKGSPLRRLLAHIFSPGRRNRNKRGGS
ncbi:hypothetical protein F4821DRAFT_274197 [Hypoxylon rubiginosum]|uniref:Uncharacterized protein n=1 Tax=Hypoxylon rubiginosum TaxID=110542 RepID=A0ACC0DM13_9PEZI|nr:hypothetical protein F4821DRAFT_274197 [Hypoxylon rubiginosum]